MTEFVLEVLDGDLAGEIIPLGGGSLSVGRRQGNDLILADEKVSGQHAVIVLEEGQWVLRDLGSTNGTLMEGRRIQEVGLTADDIIQLGRTRVAFKQAGAPTPTGAGPSLRTVDSATLARTRRRGGTTALLGLLLAVAGVGIWFLYFRDPEQGRVGATGTPPLRVAGNLLPDELADMEGEQGWDPVVGGGFVQVVNRRRSHTGSAFLEASRIAAEPGEPPDPSVALARTATDQIVTPGSSLRARAWIRSSGEARGALRLRFSSSVEDEPLVMYTGTVPAQFSEYAEVEVSAGVPDRCDRVAVEILALLPEDGCDVAVDDVSLERGAEAVAQTVQLVGRRVIRTGNALAMSSAEQILIRSVRPIVTDPTLVELDAAGLLCLSDAGLNLSLVEADGVLTLSVGGGGQGLRLLLDPDLVSLGILARAGSEPFTSHGTAVSLDGANSLLIGSGVSRMLVRREVAGPVSGQPAGGEYELQLPGVAEVHLVHVFAEEEDRAAALLTQARRDRREGNYESALDATQELSSYYPHDDDLLREALTVRNEVRDLLGERIGELESEVAKVVYFGSLRGYRRIQVSIDALLAMFGAKHIVASQMDRIEAVRVQVETEIAAIVGEQTGIKRNHLEALARIYADSSAELASLIQKYIEEHLRQ